MIFADPVPSALIIFFFLSTETMDFLLVVIVAFFIPKSYVSPLPRVSFFGTVFLLFSPVALGGSVDSFLSGASVSAGSGNSIGPAGSPGALMLPSSNRISGNRLISPSTSGTTSSAAPTSRSASSKAISLAVSASSSLVNIEPSFSATPVKESSIAITRTSDSCLKKKRFMIVASPKLMIGRCSK